MKGIEVMEIFLLRHAIAEDVDPAGGSDAERPLSTSGIAKMKKAARGMNRLIGEVDTIFTSPLKRAFETAMITARILKIEDRVRILEPLSPGASSVTLLEALRNHGKFDRIILVGHNPSLSLFASTLLGINQQIVDLSKSGLCRVDLESLRTPKGTLCWVLTPKILCNLAE
jgi:Phosphohistidine phosphatase SixA